VDHLTQVDADAELHSAMLRHAFIPPCHPFLNLRRTFDRSDGTPELGQHAVARGVDDPATELGHQRQHNRLVALEVAHSGDLVITHQPRVAGDVRGDDGGEAPVDLVVHYSSCRPIGMQAGEPEGLHGNPTIGRMQRNGRS
jgi:hypothetical protein